MTRMLMIVWE